MMSHSIKFDTKSVCANTLLELPLYIYIYIYNNRVLNRFGNSTGMGWLLVGLLVG